MSKTVDKNRKKKCDLQIKSIKVALGNKNASKFEKLSLDLIETIYMAVM